MINTIFGVKIGTAQRYTKNGMRIPVTLISAEPSCVVRTKSKDKDGYNALQLGWGTRKMNKTNKALRGYLKKAGFEKSAFLHLKEVKIDNVPSLKVGDQVKLIDVLKPGDKIKITGRSKGKGFAGVVKRWGFKGGPKTHGQSDRQRAPGSIGQTTTPGRVYKGKKMAGRMGGVQVTISGLTVAGIDEEKNILIVKGLVPGPKNGFLIITKTGEEKRFIPLLAVGEKEIQETEEQKMERLKREKAEQEVLKEAPKEKNA